MSPREFARRRRQLMRMMRRGGIAILPAAPRKLRNRDVEYAYRQDSDFYYLTGFGEPEAVTVLVPGRAHAEYILFCRDRDPKKEVWHGRIAGPAGAVADYGADDAFPIADIDDILPGLLEHGERVYYTMGTFPEFDQRVIGWVRRLRERVGSGAEAPQEFVALDHLLHDMRLYKSRSEISAMRKSAKVAVAAHQRAMRMIRPGLHEYEVEAEFIHEFRRNDARYSYSPIVAAGANACTLHYVDNTAALEDGQWLLIDAGCELDYYASGITRTVPVSGKFSPEQSAVYEIVLEAQLAAIEKTRKDNHWNEPHDAAVALEGQHVRDDTVQEPSIVADHDGAPGERHQRILERAQCVDIQVVGRLIEQQEVGATAEQFGDVHAIALAPRELSDPGRLRAHREAELVQEAAHAHHAIP